MKLTVTQPGLDLAISREAADLESQVQFRLGGQVRDFRLVVADKGLILRGRAQSYHAKQLAQHAVMEAHALPILANEIEVA
jgi:hypothetical protein